MASDHKLDQMIDRHELVKLVPYSLTHIKRLEVQGNFPARIRLGPHRVGWSLVEVQNWITERKDARALAAE
jgi:predicted DNA-binding transcriptional regulator AlpA